MLRLLAALPLALALLGCGGEEPDAPATATPRAASTATATASVKAGSADAPLIPPGAAPLALVSITNPAPRNSTASIVVQTTPNAACTLTYRTPSGGDSTAQGLGPATADAAGRVRWSWMIGQGTTPGTGRLTIACAGASITADLLVN